MSNLAAGETLAATCVNVCRPTPATISRQRQRGERFVVNRSSSRIAGLDGVRAFAVIAVIAAHAHVPLTHGGGVGVDIFFGLSGFLITYLLLQEHAQFDRIDVKKFWLRRILRLFPALILMVAAIDVLATVSIVAAPSKPLAQTLVATPSVLLYFGNWLIVVTSSPALGWFGPMWSLAVEEQFYLLWPLIVILCLRARRGVRVLAVTAGLISVAATVGRFVTFNGSDMYRTFGTDFRVDMLTVGALLAIAIYTGRTTTVQKASRALLVPACAVIITAIIVMPDFDLASGAQAQRWYYWVGLPFVGLSTATVVGYLFTHQKSRLASVLEWRPLAYTGRISYGMYLWHYPILMAVAAATKHAVNPLLWFIVGLIGTYVMAGLSFRFVERPLQHRFHGRLRPARPALSGSAA